MKTTISTFKEKASHPEQAIVMIFDLEGFSKFFSQPDVQDYVSQYLNIVLEAVEITINGGTAYWNPKQGKPNVYSKLPAPIHSKFLGDGGLYIWKYKDFTHGEIIFLVNRLYNLRLKFDEVVKKAMDQVPVVDIPKNIRFGISAGSVYKLNYTTNNREEYIGYSINLASRLQSYCREIGFIMSARINIKTTELEKNLYIKQVATNIKGFPQEIVIVDKSSIESLDAELKERLFTES